MKTINLNQWMVVLLSLSIFLASCKDDDDIKITGAYANGAFIANEGNTSGNGSVSFYSFDQDSVYNNIFHSVNSRNIGTFVQDITVHNEKAYIVVNGSNKVEVVNANTFKELGVVNDLGSPRYFLGVDNNKGYVSQWGEDGVVKVIDLQTYTVIKTITTGAGPERMILHNNLIYVANSGGLANAHTVSVIDPSTDEVVKTITLTADSPRDFVVDANNTIWVLCTGHQDFSSWPDIIHTPSKLVKINPITNNIIATITISDELHPTCLETNLSRNEIFYGGGYGFTGIYTMNITDTSVPSTPLIDKDFYGFNINPKTGDIFALDATDFSSNGILYRYDPNGTLLGDYETGVGPNGANFKK